MLEKQTKPKPLYNEASLLKAMETSGKEIEDEELRQAMKESGLGTPATRASIIETLLKRNYITREKKTLVPTATGLAVTTWLKQKRSPRPNLPGNGKSGWKKSGAAHRSASSKPRSGSTPARSPANCCRPAGPSKKHWLRLPTKASRYVRCAKKVLFSSTKKPPAAPVYKEGCNFVIWRTLAGKKLTDNQIKMLIEKGKTPVLKGFKNKAGKPFQAALMYKNGEVVFDFV